MGEHTLNSGEAHPMAYVAAEYINENMEPALVESIASTALSGNRTAEICWSTWERLQKNEPVSDRYILGLAWFVRQTKGRSK